MLCERTTLTSFFRALNFCLKVLQKNKLQFPSLKKQPGKIQLFKEQLASGIILNLLLRRKYKENCYIARKILHLANFLFLHKYFPLLISFTEHATIAIHLILSFIIHLSAAKPSTTRLGRFVHRKDSLELRNIHSRRECGCRWVYLLQ